jgi:quinoprotein glucose dehydrogenase
VRVIAADGTLLATPYATLPVLTGGERGLLGLCLAPDFATSGRVYVAASTAAGDGHPARNRVVRFTGTGDVATSGPEVIVDDLPIGDTQNGGAVEFGPDGMLYVTVGDTGDELLAQSDSSRAGRVLRFTPDGAIPDDGPIQGSPEFARGFRNPFDITFHPSTGGLFASENGPTAHDELDFVQRGKNFEWGAEPEAIPGPVVGRRIIDWTPVIVPTGIVFHDGAGFGPEYADNLFVAGYDKGDVRRLVLSGPSYSDLDAEIPFLAFDEDEFGLKPLDIQRAADGSLWVATFTAIWRISRNAP